MIIKLGSYVKSFNSHLFALTTIDKTIAVKFQSKAQEAKSKNPFFKNSFISFHISIYKFILSEKYTNFRIKCAGSPNCRKEILFRGITNNHLSIISNKLSALALAKTATEIVCPERKNQSK